MAGLSVSNHLKSNYDTYYEEWNSEWRLLGAQAKTRNIISLCANYPHDSIVEVGAGDGSILQLLSKNNFGKELYGLEISSTGIDSIQKKKIESLIECKLFNGYEMPYEDKKFDLAILSHVVEHVEYPRKLIYETSRIAKHIFIEVPLECTLGLSNDFVFDKVGHINFYSPKLIRVLAQTCNLSVLDQKITNSSKQIYTYRSGKKGIIKYLAKELLLTMVPQIAPIFFTYNMSMICSNLPINS